MTRQGGGLPERRGGACPLPREPARGSPTLPTPSACGPPGRASIRSVSVFPALSASLPHCLHRKRCAVHTPPDRSTCWTSSVSVGDGPGQLSGARVVGRGGLHRLAGLEDSFVLVSQTLNHACIRASGAISSFGSVRVHSLKGVPWTVRPGPCSESMLSLETCCRRFDGRRGTKPGHTG